MIRRYLQFINEATESAETEEVETSSLETDESPSSEFLEVRDELRSMIKKSSEKANKEYDSFIKDYLRNPKDIKIEGLISDSDIFKFYQKWRNDIDEILNKVNFFDERPSEINAIGLYKYIIIGTKKAIIEFLKSK